MGRRGPPAKPTAAKKREGTYRADRAPKNEPEPKVGVPPIPASLARDKDAKGCWDLLAPQLVDLGLLTEVDGTALEGLCQQYSKAVKADRAITRHGVVMKTEYGVRANPAVTMS